MAKRVGKILGCVNEGEISREVIFLYGIGVTASEIMHKVLVSTS